jgi:hypothetical protein
MGAHDLTHEAIIGTQSALISHVTVMPILFYSQILPCCTASAFTCALPALQRAVRAVLCLCYSRLPCFIRVLHHAAPAPRCPVPCYALYMVVVLHRGCAKRGCFWPKKRHGKKVPWKLLFPPKTNFGTSPHPTGTKLKAEPCVFMYSIMA